MNYSDEIWKDIVGYEGLYQVSDLGRVKTLKFNDGKRIHTQTKLLKQCLNGNGYLVVNLSNKTKKVHRLVATTFLKNPNKLRCVNHINGIKTDNRLCNLEFCTSSYNNKEAYRLGLKRAWYEGKRGKDYPGRMKLINQYDLNENIINTWYGTGDIKRKLGYNSTGILNCCKKKKGFYTAYGYIWRYADEE